MKDGLQRLQQVSYVTNDLERALAVFRDVYGVHDFMDTGRVTFTMGSGEVVDFRVALAYVGEMQFEIIEPIGGDVECYREVLPQDGSFAIRFHHLSFRARSRDEIETLKQAARDSGHPLGYTGTFGDSAFFYADARGRLGHFLEYTYTDPAYDAALPRN
jgi:hypothetical protein